MTKEGRKIQKYPAKVDETPFVSTVVTPARHSRLVDREDAVQLTGLRKQPKRRGKNHVSQYRRERMMRPSVAEEQQKREPKRETSAGPDQQQKKSRGDVQEREQRPGPSSYTARKTGRGSVL